jgi:hypothetical protein
VRLAISGIVVALLLGGVTLVLAGLTWSDPVQAMSGSDLQDAGLALAFLTYSTVGAVIVGRRPHHGVGAILLAGGLLLQIWVCSYRYASYGVAGRATAPPGASLAAWMTTWTVVPGLGLAFALLPLLYPTGRLDSSHQRRVTWLVVLAVAFATATWATVPGPLDGFARFTNPIGIDAVDRLGLDGLGWALLMLAVATSTVTLIARYRRSSGQERLQIRWLGVAVVGVAGLLVATTVMSETGWRALDALASVIFPVAVAAVPVAVAVAIFRHNLFDLDVVISRTLTFGLLSTLIVGVYVAVVVGVGSLLGNAAGLNMVLSVVATALVAVSFEPARARAQRLANRLVFGERASPYESLAALSHRMADTIETDDVLARIARIVAAGTGFCGTCLAACSATTRDCWRW